MTVNLLQETCTVMLESGKTPADIAWIGSRDGEFACTWQEFQLASDELYDNGFGGSQVALDLVMVFKDGSWLERGEYDGSEWWQLKKVPKQQASPKKITRVFSDWGGLKEANNASS